MLETRAQLGRKYLHGEGIEIGALHYPMTVAADAQVRYVDRLPVAKLREHYPELNHLDLVNVDILDDGEQLRRFPDDSLDFIIANHMLEHTENPLGTIRQHLRKVRHNGVLYYAIPDRRYGFDTERKLTSFWHLLLDDKVGPKLSRKRHFKEWVRYINKITDPVRARAQLAELMRVNYSIHFHVWEAPTFLNFLVRAESYLRHRFQIELFQQNHCEVIAVLRRCA
jgi:predicted SAM-dependent methyltransferase